MSIHKLILGTAQFGLNYGINNVIGKPTLDKANQILELAFEKGIRTLDTAGAYLDSHKVIVLVTNRNSYSKLSSLITLARRRSKKGSYQ